VAEEERRVAASDPAEHAVAYSGLVHTYHGGSRREVRAVRGISLAVGKGECFTLLGPNGAGKTTSLDVLTGAICPPTAGEVSISGHSLTGGPQSRLRALKSLGNCPQVDPLWPSLTGRQHLLFYARVKGLPAHLRAEQADALLRALGFSAFDADKRTQGYSGGMKRKLSLAIAIIGSPPTLLLDEPSAAVDAAAKRHLWRVVKQRERSQTVILTTHSMEEAEALSDRLAIQVRGKLRCVGTPDHIKNVYGAGYQLELLVGGGSTGPSLDVVRFVAGLCPTARLLEHHEGRYLFQLPVLKAVGARPGELSVARLFQHMQEARSAIALQDYSISRPSLEQVFLRFSREQEEHDEEEAGAPEA
jgi:ABC-type multidrug transport system ATPase subunit